ncbi:hypothetical protein [Metasolibacillus fluoroglycofenilyticus]|uniref:hypothetical protein n=1 Tax=Metasolibacillus fluoroglycofenilyticus TaxID=1239396 RepID=UPI000D338BA5|nr:hypothetical protein [Metasolibacillus fluoroglycofenilyticus]
MNLLRKIMHCFKKKIINFFKANWRYLKFFLIPSIILAILLFLLVKTNNNNNVVFIVFRAIKDKSLYSILDNKVATLLNFDQLISEAINFFGDIFIFLIGYSSVLSISVLFIYVISLILKDYFLLLRNIILKIYYNILSFFINFDKNWLTSILFIVPFMYIFLNNWFPSSQIFDYFVLLFIISPFVLGMFFKPKDNNPFYKWFLKKWLHRNIFITFVLFFLILIFSPITYNFSIYLRLFLVLYTILLYIRVISRLILFLLSFEFLLASKHKEAPNEYISYLSFEEIFKIKNKDDFSTRIDKIKKHEIFNSKYEKMHKRGEIIKERNHINLVISSSHTFIMPFIVFYNFAYNSNDEQQISNMIILFLIILLTRTLTRSFEILIAFKNDTLSSTPKQSLLDGNERIKLILTSLFEIITLSWGLKLMYLIFLNPEALQFSAYSFKKMLMYYYNTFATQIFNVSLTTEFGFFFASIHVIQILVSACLILLSLAVYSGNKEKKSVYEMTKKNSLYCFSETTFINNKKVSRISPLKKDFKGFQEDWEEDRIDTELFEQIIFCYKELEQKEKSEKEQIEYLTQVFDKTAKLKTLFKKFK